MNQLGSVIANAYLDYEVWAELHRQAHGLRPLQAKHEKDISPLEDLPEEYLDVRHKFQYYLPPASSCGRNFCTPWSRQDLCSRSCMGAGGSSSRGRWMWREAFSPMSRILRGNCRICAGGDGGGRWRGLTGGVGDVSVEEEGGGLRQVTSGFSHPRLPTYHKLCRL